VQGTVVVVDATLIVAESAGGDVVLDMTVSLPKRCFLSR